MGFGHIVPNAPNVLIVPIVPFFSCHIIRIRNIHIRMIQHSNLQKGSFSMQAPNLGFVLLFVDDPLESCVFYSRLFNLKPVEQAPTFALFAFANGVSLGLWSRKTAEPAVNADGGGSEICFSENDVDKTYEKWNKLGIPMAQEPTDMDFGRTFVALDPDGHRIRIYKLWEESR